MKCKNCNTELQEGVTVCPNCDKQVEVETTTKSSGGSIGWGVLGFFVPIAGLILFIVWLKKKEKDAKAAGLGALIGFLLSIIGIVMFVLYIMGYLNGSISGGTNTYDVTAKKTSEIEENGFYGSQLKTKYYTYYYSVDLDPAEAKADFYNDVKYNIYDGNKKLLFKLEWEKMKDKGCKFIMNSGDSFNNSECILYSYNFAYYNDLLVFGDTKTMREDFYVYDLTNNKLTKVYAKSENPNFEVIDYNIDNKDSLVFTTFYSHFNDEGNVGYRKEQIINDIELSSSGNLNTIADLEKRLADEGFGDFTVRRALTFTKGNEGYIQKDVKETTIKEYFNEVRNGTSVTNKCVGEVGKYEDNKYKYAALNKKLCNIEAFKLNDDFTVEYHYGTGDDYSLYVNDKFVDSGVLFGEPEEYYVVGKTLVTREFSTDAGAPVFLVNTSGEIYSVTVGSEYKENYSLDGMITKAVKVDDNGDLIISGTRHSNQRGEGINGTYVDQVEMCNTPFSTLMSSNGVSDDYAFEADYTFKLKDNGLYNLEYSKATTTRLWKDFYNSLCN